MQEYGIRNFFFRADTFTWDRDWVVSVCKEILKRKLDIEWVANSRANTVDDERLIWMKKAGCWLVSFGVESGNQYILDKTKKGIARRGKLAIPVDIRWATTYPVGTSPMA